MDCNQQLLDDYVIRDVKRIKVVCGMVSFQVNWLGFPDSEEGNKSSWVKLQNMEKCIVSELQQRQRGTYERIYVRANAQQRKLMDRACNKKLQQRKQVTEDISIAVNFHYKNNMSFLIESHSDIFRLLNNCRALKQQPDLNYINFQTGHNHTQQDIEQGQFYCQQPNMCDQYDIQDVVKVIVKERMLYFEVFLKGQTNFNRCVLLPYNQVGKHIFYIYSKEINIQAVVNNISQAVYQELIKLELWSLPLQTKVECKDLEFRLHNDNYAIDKLMLCNNKCICGAVDLKNKSTFSIPFTKLPMYIQVEISNYYQYQLCNIVNQLTKHRQGHYLSNNLIEKTQSNSNQSEYSIYYSTDLDKQLVPHYEQQPEWERCSSNEPQAKVNCANSRKGKQTQKPLQLLDNKEQLYNYLLKHL